MIRGGTSGGRRWIVGASGVSPLLSRVVLRSIGLFQGSCTLGRLHGMDYILILALS